MQVEDTERGAVAQESHLLAVGADDGLESVAFAGVERRLGDSLGVSERGVLLANFSLVELPAAVAFGVIDHEAAVGAEADGAFLSGSGGDAARGGIVGGSGEDVAAHHKSHLIAGGGESHARGARVDHRFLGLLAIVGNDSYGELHRLRAGRHGVYFAVLAEGHVAVLRHAEGAHRVLGEVGELTGSSAVERGGIYVEGGVGLAHIVEAVAAAPLRVDAVIGGVSELAEHGFAAQGAFHEPDVAGARRLFMLAEFVFVALFVGVEDASVVIHREGDGGEAEEEFRAASAYGHGVELREDVAVDGLLRGHDVACEDDFVAGEG